MGSLTGARLSGQQSPCLSKGQGRTNPAQPLLTGCVPPNFVINLSVDHSVFLAKLRLYGVKGQLFYWFKDYLTERTQRLVLEGAASLGSPVTSGVPQGSILGPLLFTLFANDLPDEAADGVKAALYADNTKLYRNVSSTEHCDSIQDTLSNMHDGSLRNNIRFNTSKCKAPTVTRKKTPITAKANKLLRFSNDHVPC